MDPTFWVPPNTYLGTVGTPPPLKGPPPRRPALSYAPEACPPKGKPPSTPPFATVLPSGKVAYTYSISPDGKGIVHGHPPKALGKAFMGHTAVTTATLGAPGPMMPTSKAAAITSMASVMPKQASSVPYLPPPPPPKTAPYGITSKSKPSPPISHPPKS